VGAAASSNLPTLVQDIALCGEKKALSGSVPSPIQYNVLTWNGIALPM
jgi:hypothetical protein